MAETKTTTSRARTTKAKTQTTNTKAKTENKEVESKVEITLDTPVEVFNNTHGRLVYQAKKGNGYLYLENFMDSDILTVEELQVMKNAHRKMITEGWIYIDNEDVLEFLRLQDVKDSVQNPQALEDMVLDGNPDIIIETFNKLSTTSKGSLYKIIKKKFANNEFNNAFVIKEIEQKLDIPSDLSLLSD